MHQREQRRTLVLLSGGLDSSACVHFYQSQRHRVDTLFVNYGQAAVSSERRSARRIAKHYNCDHRELTIDGGVEKSVGVIRGRNALLLLIALLEWEARAGIIAIGIHGGTRYPDCTPDFIRKVQSVFDLYTAGAICSMVKARRLGIQQTTSNPNRANLQLRSRESNTMWTLSIVPRPL
jgi:7-cyano-7-deazaguanine synthase